VNQFIDEFRTLETDYLLSRRALGSEVMSTEAHEAIEQVLKERGVDCPALPSAPIILDSQPNRVRSAKWIRVGSGLFLFLVGAVFIEFSKRTWVGVILGTLGLGWMFFAWFRREAMTPEQRAEYDDRQAVESGNLSQTMQAAGAGDVARLHELIQYGADVNQQTPSGNTALMYAARNNHLEAVKLLLEVGTNPHIKTERGNTARTFAEKAGHRHVVELLAIHSASAREGQGARLDK